MRIFFSCVIISENLFQPFLYVKIYFYLCSSVKNILNFDLWLLISVAAALFFIEVFTTSKTFLVLTWLNTNLRCSPTGCHQAWHVSRGNFPEDCHPWKYEKMPWHHDAASQLPLFLDAVVLWPWNLDAVVLWSWNLMLWYMGLHGLVFVFTKSVMQQINVDMWVVNRCKLFCISLNMYH